MNTQKVFFTNLSYFEPEIFEWEFGDGQTSTMKDPDFIEYNSTGSYDICLTVSSFFGTDTYCKNLIIGDTTSVVEPVQSDAFSIYPNPFNSDIHIISNTFSGNYIFSLFSSDGRLQLRKMLSGTYHTETINVKEGLYFYSISRKGENVQIGKLLKLN